MGGIAGLCGWVWGYLQPIIVELLALLGASVAVFIAYNYRRKKKLQQLSRDQFQTTFFSGASLVLLIILAVSAWVNTALVYMLEHERLILVGALIFAAYDELLRIAGHCKGPGLPALAEKGRSE